MTALLSIGIYCRSMVNHLNPRPVVYDFCKHYFTHCIIIKQWDIFIYYSVDKGAPWWYIIGLPPKLNSPGVLHLVYCTVLPLMSHIVFHYNCTSWKLKSDAQTNLLFLCLQAGMGYHYLTLNRKSTQSETYAMLVREDFYWHFCLRTGHG